MADSEWFEIDGEPDRYPNAESVRDDALRMARGADEVILVYRCTRTLVRTIQRNVTVTETDVSA